METARRSSSDWPRSHAARRLILRVISPLSNGPYPASNATLASMMRSSAPSLPPAMPREAAVRRIASSVLRSSFPAQNDTHPRAAAANARMSGTDGLRSFGHMSNTPIWPEGGWVRRFGFSCFIHGGTAVIPVWLTSFDRTAMLNSCSRVSRSSNTSVIDSTRVVRREPVPVLERIVRVAGTVAGPGAGPPVEPPDERGARRDARQPAGMAVQPFVSLAEPRLRILGQSEAFSDGVV